MRWQGYLSVERLCRLTQVSRAGFYRYLRGNWQDEEEVALRSAVRDFVIAHHWRYGYRRVTAALRARGMSVNHERVARIMREDNLLAFRREIFKPRKDSLRAARIYLNLASHMTLLGPNQLCAADITYVRLTCDLSISRWYLMSFLERSSAGHVAGA
jgi:putative transposase